MCEEGGGWFSSGPAYPDSLGISAANWYANGGTADVSEDAQIMVARRKKMMKYLKRTNLEQFKLLVSALGLEREASHL